MSIQPISSSNNQYVSPISNDISNIQDQLKSLETAQNSGNQDQITISQDALQKAMNQFQTDVANLPQGAQGAGGHHHHHHHHGVKGSNSGDGTVSSTSTDSSILGANVVGQTQPTIGTTDQTV